MTELQLPQIGSLGAFFEGRNAGREVKRQKTLGEYMQPATQGDQNALAKVYGVDPDAAMKAQTHAGQLKGEAAQQLVQQAKWFTQAPETMKPQLYASLVKTAHAAGMDYIPEAYDPQFAKGIEQLAGVGQQDNTPASIRELQILHSNPELAALDMKRRTAGFGRPQLFTDASGNVMWLTPPTEGGSQPAPTTGGGAQVLDGALTSAVMQQESGGNPNAVSSAGARGLMQLMPGTQRDPGFGVQPAKDDSPQENVRVGRDYLQAMLSRYNGDQQLALAAYNAGPGRVDQALKAAGGDPQRAIASLPAETRNYVPSVQARMGQGSGAVAIPGVRGKAAGRDAPSGYQWNAAGTSLEPQPGGPADRKNNPTASDQAKGEMQLRKELSDRIKEPRSVMTMFQKVQAAASQPSAANDLAMIFAYMKMLDPGSVVREQEFANAQNAAGVPDQIRNAWNKTLRGERLNEAQRAQFVQSAGQVASLAQQQITNATHEYQGMADEYGYDSRRATGMPDFRNVNTTQQPSAGGGSDIDALLDKYK